MVVTDPLLRSSVRDPQAVPADAVVAERMEEPDFLQIDERQRRQLKPTAIPTKGVWEAWQAGDSRARKALVETLFDSLLIEDGEITGWTPKAERQAEVVNLMKSLVGIRLEGFSAALTTRRGLILP